jgi:hypothetical protein
MSALGHKRTFAVQNAMSALPPIADMCSAKRDVRLVPIADIPVVSPEGPLGAYPPRIGQNAPPVAEGLLP